MNSFSARAPIVNTSEDIQLQVTFGLSGIGETVGTTDLTISVEPQRDEILGLSLSESPGGREEWATITQTSREFPNFMNLRHGVGGIAIQLHPKRR